ncbi:MAG: 1,6-anhydro-N-acetylmuramyl-L-alanine amidase AmpD [Pseudomonadota bacterium]
MAPIAVIANGWHRDANIQISPNMDDRPAGEAIDLLVIHAISLPPAQFGGSHVRDFFQNRLRIDEHDYFKKIATLRVSSHFFIPRSGDLIQFVSTDKRAWHCGESEFQGRTKCNDFSIGVELEGCDTAAFTEQQYTCLAALTSAICEYYPRITHERITGHVEIAPGRKTDPGPHFDWQRYKKLIN